MLACKDCSRVPTPFGSPGIVFCKISRTWKVVENEFGPGNLSARSWSPGICYAVMQTQNNCKKVLEQFLCYFFTACDSDKRILQYD